MRQGPQGVVGEGGAGGDVQKLELVAVASKELAGAVGQLLAVA